MPRFSKVLAGLANAVRFGPHKTAIESPPLGRVVVRKLGIAPTALIRASWSGRSTAAWMNTGRWSRMPYFFFAFSMACNAWSAAASPSMCM